MITLTEKTLKIPCNTNQQPLENLEKLIMLTS
jgi:hypothetical protein